MPSGASPAMGRPSNATVPSLAGVSPAMISSKVDLPQPDGPDNGEELAALQLEVDRPQRVQRRRRAARHEGLADVAQADLLSRHGSLSARLTSI